MTIDTPAAWRPVRDGAANLSEQIVDNLVRRICDQGLRAGTRLPSIREMAEQAGVSRFTVVEAYDRLVARGYAESRRGSGFYVRARNDLSLVDPAAPRGAEFPSHVDVNWLLRSTFIDSNLSPLPGGGGLMPPSWLDTDMVTAAIRAVGRSAGRELLGYGVSQGYLPLRQQVAASLQAAGVPAHPEHNLLTTSGVTHGLDLVARYLVKPGDTVLVEDPAWYLIFGRLAAFGANLVGVPRGVDGPDVAALDRLAAQYRPKAFIVNSAVHNPTGSTLAAGVAYEVLRLAERHDFMVIEDDTYSDLHPGVPIRLAALDRLNRVILAGGYAKMLAAGLRVGYLAAAPETVRKLADLKLLGGLTSCQLSERVVHRVLADGQYRRHVDRVRARVDAARARSLKEVERLGLHLRHEPGAGMFLWVDCGRDTETLACQASDRGVLLAPGTLFSPAQAPSTMLRLSVGMADHPESWQMLRSLLAAGR